MEEATTTSLSAAVRKSQKSYSAFGESIPEAQEGASSTSVGLPGVCLCILVVELCERLAFYTFTGTQEPFLEISGYSLSQSAALNSAMTTLCMTWSLLACWTADVSLG